MNSGFRDRLNIKIAEVEAVVREYSPKPMTEETLLCEAMNYSLLAGGKRLRPLLMFETYSLYG